MGRDRAVTFDEYERLCASCDVSAALAPQFVLYYYSRLRMKPKIVARRDSQGSIVAAFPSLYRMIFPTTVHKRLLPRSGAILGDIGQPESLFPVLKQAGRISLNHLSPTTSALLVGRVRAFGQRSLRRMAIAKERKHKKLTARMKAFMAEGGAAHFTDELPAAEFADAYLRLHCKRWGYDPESLKPVREQILALYPHVQGTLLTRRGIPVAAQLCHRHVGPSLYYVDFINSGVERSDDNTISYGSVMMLASLRRAEEQARTLGRTLRFSFGFSYSDSDYKAVWTDVEPTFIGI